MAALVLMGGPAGCGPGVKVETGKLVPSFQGAPTKGDIDQAAAAITAGDYVKAVAAFKKVIKAGALTPEQKDAITTAVTGMQMIASQDPNKYPGDVYQSLSDLITLMEGQEPVPRKP